MSQSIRFLIVATGYNCGQFVRANYSSVLKQTYDNWKLVMISDGSTDETARQLVDLLPVAMRDARHSNLITSGIGIHSKDGNKIIKHYPDNLGAAFRRWHAIHKYAEPDDVIVLLGMDDALMPKALMRIKDEYDNGKLMTYGNWENQFGDMLPDDFALYFDEETHAARSYRRVKFRSTAPNTFAKFLFDRISMNDFIIDNKWIMQTTESPLMFACLEMCGKERIGIIKEPIYLYNQRFKQSAKKRLGKEAQDKIYQTIINRPKYPLYEKRILAQCNE